MSALRIVWWHLVLGILWLDNRASSKPSGADYPGTYRMATLRGPLLVALAWATPGVAALAFGGGHDRKGPWVGASGPQVDRHILIRVDNGRALIEGDAAEGWTGTGIGEIDELGRLFAVNAVHRLHPEPPRGRRDPANFQALGLDRMYYVQFRQPLPDTAMVVAAYASRDAIEAAWSDRIVRNCSVPNDTLYYSQWNFFFENLDCEPAWDRITKSDVLISVIDSGTDLKHLDIDANLWTNSGEIAGNKLDDDGNGYVDDIHGWDFWNADGDPTDDYGHGTHVAGIVGAEGNNGRDVAGVCWTATIQSIKVLDSQGAGTWSSIAQGMVYAADNGAVIANMSLGDHSYDAGVESAALYAAGLDIVQVAAAGNSASSSPFYPAAYDGVIAVMASDYAEKRARWSNYGSWCDLCAPGDGITSLWKGGKTSVLTGTSQSSPHVAAIAALLRSANPQLDRVDVELAIKYGAKDLGTLGRDSTYEWGLADLHRSLDMATSLTLSTQTTTEGGSVDLFVFAQQSANDVYLILPSTSGREPGYNLGVPFPGEVRIVPINYDLVTDLSLALPGIGVWNGFVGNLDIYGKATANFVVPSGRIFRDKLNYFSGIILPSNDLSLVKSVLNSVVLDVQ
jgi:subtilisin family serine protease